MRARSTDAPRTMDVLFTVDTEVWCPSWVSLDRDFPHAFKRYVYGPTPAGDYGLPLKLSVLRDHGLKAVFFTEALFATRFGRAPLDELVGLLQSGGQEVQLHLHTEWVDEARPPLLGSGKVKRQFMRDFTLPEQVHLIELGASLLRQAGAKPFSAFRAGSFGMGRDTINAVGKAGLRFDASYNQTLIPPTHNPLPSGYLVQPARLGDVIEYPATMIWSGGRLRHLQLGACSFREIEAMLWAARDAGWQSVVILAHNFDLMNATKTDPDRVLVRRFRRLCEFLDRHRNEFRTRWFADLGDRVVDRQPAVPRIGRLHRRARQIEQAWRAVRYH